MPSLGHGASVWNIKLNDRTEQQNLTITRLGEPVITVDNIKVAQFIRNELRKHDYLPIMFDFQPSANQATLETIKTLAIMARFVIADLTDARSVLMELGAIVPAFPSVAVRLLIKKSDHEYGMLDFIRRFRSVVGQTEARDSPP
jgi:hypothetical protein